MFNWLKPLSIALTLGLSAPILYAQEEPRGTDTSFSGPACQPLTEADGTPTPRFCAAGQEDIVLKVPVENCKAGTICPDQEIRVECATLIEPYLCVREETSSESCTASDLDNFTEIERHCTEEAPNGSCIRYDINYVSNLGSTTCTGSAPINSNTCVKSLLTSATDKCNDDFYGTCIDETFTEVCQAGSAPRCNNDNKCSFSAKKCVNFDQDGLCIEEEQTYNCVEDSTECALFENTETCFDPDGLEPKVNITREAGPDSENLAKVVAATALTSELAKDTLSCPTNTTSADQCSNAGSATSAPTTELTPRIFNGTLRVCQYGVGLGRFLGSDTCCKIGLADQKGKFKLGCIFGSLAAGCNCTESEVELSAARASNRAVYVGTICTQRIKLGFIKFCIKNGDYYCTFNSIMAKVVQQQGRAQLASMTQSGALNPTTRTLQFPYYSNTDQGVWSTPVSSNSITTRGYSWPKYCSNRSLFEAKIEQDASALYSCPTVEQTYFAICEKAGGCTKLPTDPRLGDGDYQIAYRNPESTGVAAATSLVTMDGSCQNLGNCNYTVGTLTDASSRALFTMDLDFMLYDFLGAVYQIGSQPGIDPTKTFDTTAQKPAICNKFSFFPQCDTFRAGQEINSGKISYQAIVLNEKPAQLPATIPIAFSTDSGKTYNIRTIPTNIPISSPIRLSNDPEVFLTGGCDSKTMRCQYKSSVRLTVRQKPWGFANGADCSGFDLEQFQLLDFGKMDLSEFISSIKPTLPDTSKLAQSAASDAQAFLELFTDPGDTTAKANNPGGYAVLNLSKREQLMGSRLGTAAPKTTVRLTATNFWPRKGENPAGDITVREVRVDWGDGNVSLLSPGGPNGLLVGTKEYTYGSALDVTRNGCQAVNNKYTKDREVFCIKAQFSLSDGTFRFVTTTFAYLDEAVNPDRTAASGGYGVISENGMTSIDNYTVNRHSSGVKSNNQVGLPPSNKLCSDFPNTPGCSK